MIKRKKIIKTIELTVEQDGRDLLDGEFESIVISSLYKCRPTYLIDDEDDDVLMCLQDMKFKDVQ